MLIAHTLNLAKIVQEGLIGKHVKFHFISFKF